MPTKAATKRRTSPAQGRTPAKKPGSADRLRALARRCRVVAEDTAMPEISQELTHIAEALEDEADTVAGR
ncbi:MAG: hypothetical protein FJX60_17425 [Alphaproteobacteria bacterium]|nr:hypothetical protein [Alphaproteobacteria bacterium]